MKKFALILLATALVAGCDNSERQKASDEKMTGTVQEQAGQLTNDKDLTSEGQKNKLKGDLRDTKEDVKDMMKSN